MKKTAIEQFWEQTMKEELPYQLGSDVELNSCITAQGEIHWLLNSSAPERWHAQGPKWAAPEKGLPESASVHITTSLDLMATAIAYEGLRIWIQERSKEIITESMLSDHFIKAEMAACHILARSADAIIKKGLFCRDKELMVKVPFLGEVG